MSQDLLLINGTIRDNIAFCQTDASDAQVAAAADAADFIAALPAGYNTVVEGRRFRLSGSQRQRLYLDRALMRAPIC